MNQHFKEVPHGLWSDGSPVPVCTCKDCMEHKKEVGLRHETCVHPGCAYHKPKPEGWPNLTCPYRKHGKKVQKPAKFDSMKWSKKKKIWEVVE